MQVKLTAIDELMHTWPLVLGTEQHGGQRVMLPGRVPRRWLTNRIPVIFTRQQRRHRCAATKDLRSSASRTLVSFAAHEPPDVRLIHRAAAFLPNKRMARATGIEPTLEDRAHH